MESKNVKYFIGLTLALFSIMAVFSCTTAQPGAASSSSSSGGGGSSSSSSSSSTSSSSSSSSSGMGITSVLFSLDTAGSVTPDGASPNLTIGTTNMTLLAGGQVVTNVCATNTAVTNIITNCVTVTPTSSYSEIKIGLPDFTGAQAFAWNSSTNLVLNIWVPSGYSPAIDLIFFWNNGLTNQTYPGAGLLHAGWNRVKVKISDVVGDPKPILTGFHLVVCFKNSSSGNLPVGTPVAFGQIELEASSLSVVTKGALFTLDTAAGITADPSTPNLTIGTTNLELVGTNIQTNVFATNNTVTNIISNCVTITPTSSYGDVKFDLPNFDAAQAAIWNGNTKLVLNVWIPSGYTPTINLIFFWNSLLNNLTYPGAGALSAGWNKVTVNLHDILGVPGYGVSSGFHLVVCFKNDSGGGNLPVGTPVGFGQIELQ